MPPCGFSDSSEFIVGHAHSISPNTFPRTRSARVIHGRNRSTDCGRPATPRPVRRPLVGRQASILLASPLGPITGDLPDLFLFYRGPYFVGLIEGTRAPKRSLIGSNAAVAQDIPVLGSKALKKFGSSPRPSGIDSRMVFLDRVAAVPAVGHRRLHRNSLFRLLNWASISCALPRRRDARFWTSSSERES